jgi:hypothetical protein
MQRSILSLLLSEAECYFILNIYLSLLISPVIFLNIEANFHIYRLQSIFGGSTSGVGNNAINLSKTTEHYLQTDMNWNQPQIINNRVLRCEATSGILCKAFAYSRGWFGSYVVSTALKSN